MLNFKRKYYIKKYIQKTEEMSKEIISSILQKDTIKIEKKKKEINENLQIFAIKVSGITKKTNLKNNIYFILKLQFSNSKVIPSIKIEHEYEINEDKPFSNKILELLKKEGYQ